MNRGIGERAMSTSTSQRQSQSAPVNVASNVGRKNPAVRNATVKNPAVRNATVKNPAVRNATVKNPAVKSFTVTCKICDACYSPAPARADLLQVGPDASDALEAAFMSMCHFCFRCRRPACPGCWDEVHRVCAECVQEAHLAFRADVPPLQGTVFPAPITASCIGQAAIGSDTAIAPLLICVRPGRFQHGSLPAVSSDQTRVDDRTGEYRGGDGSATPPGGRGQAVAPTSFPKGRGQAVAPTSFPKGRGQAVASTSFPKGRGQAVASTSFSNVSILKVAERVLNVVLFSLLVAIILLIIVAELSSNANAQIMVLFHVDVRSEIAYILYIVQQLRR